MKIKHILIVLLLVIVIPKFTTSQKIPLTNYTLESKKLRGNVKSIEFDEYDVIILNSNLPERILNMSIRWTFSKQGYMDSSFAFGRLGFFMKSQDDTLLSYTNKRKLYDITVFNKSKKPIQYTVFVDTNIYTTHYTYYNSNRLKTLKDPYNNVLEYRYNTQKAKKIIINNAIEKDNVYNLNLNLIQENNKSSNYISTFKYYYNENSDIIKEENFDKFKSNGIWKNDTPVIVFFTYKYDNKGNWVEKKKSKKGKVVWESIRIIEYWN